MKVAVIGGGIVGLATAYQLVLRYPSIQLLLLEKEDGPGKHQTGNNSGVLHCGLYYKPGSVKARMAVQGIRRMVEFCEEHEVPYDLCGKIVVATDKEEIPRLNALLERGQANGLEGLQPISAEQIREYEPHAAGVAGIRVPQEGIVDYKVVTEVLVREIRQRAGDVRFSSKVSRLVEGNGWRIETTSGDYSADFLINCGGLHSDRLSKMAGNRDRTQIVPFRGEYYKLREDRQHLVRNLIYPVPDPSFPFLGVHFTRMIHGGVEAGPKCRVSIRTRRIPAEGCVSSRHGGDADLSGLLEFLMRYPSMCCDEFKRSLSKALFCRSLQRLVPEIQLSDLAQGGAGVRAQALTPSGELVQDFQFVRQPRALHVLNAPSPAATASLAIADYVIDQAKDFLVA